MVKTGPETELLCIGVIGAARGLKGEVRIKSFTAEPGDLAAYGLLLDEAGNPGFSLKVVGRHKEQVVARIKGVDDRDAAEALNGTRLYVRRDQLPTPDDGEFYFADLVGLKAVLQDGTPWGKVVLADDFGAGAVLEIELVDESRVMVAFTLANVPEVNLGAGRIVVVPPDGLMEPGEPEPAGPED